MGKNKNFFRASAEDFKKIPGSPVAYWVGGKSLDVLAKSAAIGEHVESRCGMNTSNNDYYLKLWYEVGRRKIGLGYKSVESFLASNFEYAPYNKGGSFRKWFGNLEYCLWFGGKHYDELLNLGNHLPSRQFYFHSCLTWSDVTSSCLSFRFVPEGTVFDGCAAVAFPHKEECMPLLGFLNTTYVEKLSHILNPTIHFKLNDFARLPYIVQRDTPVVQNTADCCALAKEDWDAYETSWDFAVNPLVAARGGALCSSADSASFVSAPTGDGRSGQQSVVRDQVGVGRDGELLTAHCPLSTIYAAVREKWAKNCEEMRRLETENNRIFIEAYGLQDELTPEVPWHEITLTCNPWYRYGVKVDSGQCAVGSAASDHCTLPTDNLLEERLKGDTVKELISYAVGCMMGRYSLEKPGLILADQGAQISDQWIVVSGQLVLRGKVAECVRKELQRIDCLAEGDGSCGRSVSTGETAPDGGTVCIVGSASSGGGFNSVECRRGAGAEYDAGLHELSDNGTRVVLRDGNTIVDLCSAEVLDAIASGSGAELVRRGWKDAERIDWKTIHSSLTTSHFSPDEDGIIPILDNDWFADDIVTRFREFIKVAFGEVHFFENMAWIEEALGKNLRDYFTKDFYKDHLQRYQNRPIYWLFQSPKGAFRALIYMHRYKPDMVGGVLGYLRSLQTKVENQLGVATQIASDESKSSTERVRANKEVVKYAKMQKELDEYEKNVLYPLSTERIEIDLDDGVKVNYRKFGTALRKVATLEGKGE